MKRWFAYRSFRPTTQAVAAFAELGVDTVCVFPANTDCSLGVPYSPFPPIWRGPDRYHWESLDLHFGEVLAGNPNAGLLCLVDLNTPLWWTRLTRQPDSFYDLGRVAASERWRHDAGEYLRRFLAYTQENYGQHLEAYVLAAGCTTEWQDLCAGDESESRRVAWRQWNTSEGQPEPGELPSYEERERAAHGLLRDPVADRAGVDHARFNAELVGESILHFASVAQEVLRHQVALGVFYGYALEHGRFRLVHEGHLDYERVYASDDLDFFISPGTYDDRASGGASGPMLCTGSLRRRGKGFLHEIDHRTPTAASVVEHGVPVPGHSAGFRTEAETIAGLRREFANALVNGYSLWWFDMFGGWFEPPAVMAAIGQMRQLWERFAERPDGPAAEVAVVVDPLSLSYVAGRHEEVDSLLRRQRLGLGRLGAPYEVLSWADLADGLPERIRLVFFPALFVLNEERRALLAREVCGQGRTVLWGPRSGIITDGRYDERAVESLTGRPYGSPGVSPRDGWTSVLASQANLPAEELAAVAAQAGVHRYLGEAEPVYASQRLVALHSAVGGRRKIALPRPCRRVRELFSGRLVGQETAVVALDLAAPETVLLDLDDGES
ncbi:MAG: hypothetical protein HUU35_03930 [Armatimonadetes bacterium]|nr:hypothetical protein [Armatimonadota bacterium]